jgi:hypothetical protein
MKKQNIKDMEIKEVEELIEELDKKIKKMNDRRKQNGK